MRASLGNYLFIFLAIVAGIATPMQAGINARLATSVDSPIIAAFLSFCVGTAALFIYIVASGEPLSNIAAAKNAPLFAWTGGILGAFFVGSLTGIVPRIGMALTFSLVIAGQMLVTLIIDHYGLLGIPEKHITFPRIAGVLLITAGVILVRKF
jgi:transporter family-2 protein